MIKATTPTHKFTFPEEVPPSGLAKIQITYSQCGKQILVKTKDDLLFTDTTNMHTYQCTAISGGTYTWTQRW